MATVWITPTPVSVRVDGRDIFAISHHVIWIAIMDSAMLLVFPMLTTFASANLDGEEIAVTHAVHTGGALIRKLMLAIIPMNVFATGERLMQKACAITQS